MSVVSMHLLVLSAFRLTSKARGGAKDTASQCTFWCSVLSDHGSSCTTSGRPSLNAPFGAQCFPTASNKRKTLEDHCLNAPFGAQCFPTLNVGAWADGAVRLNAPFGAQCFPTRSMPHAPVRCRVSMHLLVLSAFRPQGGTKWTPRLKSQCTFWCSVLSDCFKWITQSKTLSVSMHLLVLSAFRQTSISGSIGNDSSSQCTFWCSVLSDWKDDAEVDIVWKGLNAPFGAQCFPTDGGGHEKLGDLGVSMHLLVLSAFRRKTSGRPVGALERLNAPFGAQCFPT